MYVLTFLDFYFPAYVSFMVLNVFFCICECVKICHCLPSGWWLMLLSIRLSHGEAGTIWCQVKTFTWLVMTLLFIMSFSKCPSFLLLGLSPFLCYTSCVQFIQKIVHVYYVPGTVLGAGTTAVSKQTKIPCEFYTLVGVWEEIICKINTLYSYIRKWPLLWKKTEQGLGVQVLGAWEQVSILNNGQIEKVILSKAGDME